MSDLTGKVIVVTGGRGMLGRAFCGYLRSQGAMVASLDISPAPDTHVPGVIELRADVRCDRQLDAAQRGVDECWGTPHGVVACHGVDAPPDQPGDDPWRGWLHMLDVNLTGTMNLARTFGEAMAARDRGSFVAIASMYGIVAPDQRLYPAGFVKPAGYVASKHGVIGLTKWLASYWGRFPCGVRANALAFGGVRTEQTPDGFHDRYTDRTPAQRMATPYDFVGALSYLLSDQSKYVTGTTLVIDGGYTAV